MKKILALLLSAMMLCMAFGTLAETMEPLYATVGDALAAAGENPIAGGEEDYYAVVTEIEGKYYRSVAEADDHYRELQRAVWEAELEQMEAAFAAASEYEKTLPIAYSEAFTAVPMAQAEIDALIGKTIGALREMGYEDRSSGTEGDDIVYVMRNGLFEYACTVDADFGAYEKAAEEGPDGGRDFVLKRMTFRGITNEACLKRFHTDGTIEEPPELFAGYAELFADIQEMIGQAQNGEVNMEECFNGLKEKYPDLAQAIDMYQGLYQLLGVEGLAQMAAPAE